MASKMFGGHHSRTFYFIFYKSWCYLSNWVLLLTKRNYPWTQRYESEQYNRLDFISPYTPAVWLAGSTMYLLVMQEVLLIFRRLLQLCIKWIHSISSSSIVLFVLYCLTMNNFKSFCFSMRATSPFWYSSLTSTYPILFKSGFMVHVSLQTGTKHIPLDCDIQRFKNQAMMKVSLSNAIGYDIFFSA